MCADDSLRLIPILDIPGQVQAAHFISESRKRGSERMERMKRPLHSSFDMAFVEIARAKAKEKHGSQHSSKPSEGSASLESVQPVQPVLQ